MPDEWLTYSEIGVRLGLNAEAARTRVRRAGWRTQPGNDGRTRVLVPDRALEYPDDRPGQVRPNGTVELSGLVELLTAAEARVSRLEKQLEAERVRVDESRTEADRLRTELMTAQAGLTTETDRADKAVRLAEVAEAEVAELRQAEEKRRGQGRWARLRAAWRGALLLVALPLAAHAQPLPDWPIDRLCQDNQDCVFRNVSARNFLRDTWQHAGAQKRAECLKWEGEFYRRYQPELPAVERYMNLYICADGAIDPKR